MKKLALLLVTPMLACNGKSSSTDDDTSSSANLAGLYEVTKQTLNPSSCASQGPDVAVKVDYLRLEVPETGVVDVYYCRADKTCFDTPETSWAMEELDGDWIGWDSSSYVSEQEQMCAVFYDERIMEVNTDGSVKLERTQSAGFVDTVDPDECDTAGDEWTGQGGTCMNFEVIRAQRIED